MYRLPHRSIVPYVLEVGKIRGNVCVECTRHASTHAPPVPRGGMVVRYPQNMLNQLK